MAESRRPVYLRQRELLSELAVTLAGRAPDVLDVPFARSWKDAADDGARLRVVLDQVASLTDGRAVAWHSALIGSSLGT